jgi:hypothetical protein
MANPEHLAILKQGVEVWNRWRADERKATADFSHADLRRADLCGANLRGAVFGHASLMGANLGGQDLYRTHFNSADLRGANLRAAVLYRADLSGANLSNAMLGWTVFANVDLSHVTGLEAVRHAGPSTIGIDTIFNSMGRIPESFLRGCGVLENFIAYIKSLAGTAFEFYSCFISYATEDQSFAESVYADLQARGVRCWFAPHDIQAGKKIHEQVDDAIRVYDRLLLILSDHSMSSEWVKTEIANARQREIREGRQMLFPITVVPFEQIRDWKAFDADTGKDSAREIREYFIPDFSNWKDHDSYQQAFQRLLRDLKAEKRQ